MMQSKNVTLKKAGLVVLAFKPTLVLPMYAKGKTGSQAPPAKVMKRPGTVQFIDNAGGAGLTDGLVKTANYLAYDGRSTDGYSDPRLENPGNYSGPHTATGPLQSTTTFYSRAEMQVSEVNSARVTGDVGWKIWIESGVRKIPFIFPAPPRARTAIRFNR